MKNKAVTSKEMNSIVNPSKNKTLTKKGLFSNFEHKHIFWAFLIPFGIMLGIYAALGTYPFGTSSVLVLDLNGQYVYFFEALYLRSLGVVDNVTGEKHGIQTAVGIFQRQFLQLPETLPSPLAGIKIRSHLRLIAVLQIGNSGKL